MIIDRRSFLLGIVLSTTSGCAMAEEDAGKLIAYGEKFWIDEGDGDQRYLAAPINVFLTEASWFTAEIPDFGPALLFVVVGGQHDGKYLAATSRGGILSEKLSEYGYSSAVIWHVTNPTLSYDPTSDKDLENIGMSVIWRSVKYPPHEIEGV